MTPTRHRIYVTFLATLALACSILGALYLALWTDSLLVHHCNGWGNWPYGWDVFSGACGRPKSHLGLPELVIIIAPSAAALACFSATLLSEPRRRIVMLPAVGILTAASLGSNWSYVFLPALALHVAALLLALKFNPLRWFWERLSWRFPTDRTAP